MTQITHFPIDTVSLDDTLDEIAGFRDQAVTAANTAVTAAATAEGIVDEANGPYNGKASFLADVTALAVTTVAVISGDGPVLRYIRDDAGATVQSDGTHWRLYDGARYETVAAMLAGNYLYDIGDVIEAGEHRYRKVNAGTGNMPGIDDLDVLPGKDGRFNVLAFGADATGGVSSQDAFVAAHDAAGDDGAWFVPKGKYLLPDTFYFNNKAYFYADEIVTSGEVRWAVSQPRAYGSWEIAPETFGVNSHRGHVHEWGQFTADILLRATGVNGPGIVIGGGVGSQITELRNSYKATGCGVNILIGGHDSAVTDWARSDLTGEPVSTASGGNGEYIDGWWVGALVAAPGHTTTGKGAAVSIEVVDGDIVSWALTEYGYGYTEDDQLTVDVGNLWPSITGATMGGTGAGWVLNVKRPGDAVPNTYTNNLFLGDVFTTGFAWGGISVSDVQYSSIQNISNEGGATRGLPSIRGIANGLRIGRIYHATNNANVQADPGADGLLIDFNIWGDSVNVHADAIRAVDSFNSLAEKTTAMGLSADSSHHSVLVRGITFGPSAFVTGSYPDVSATNNSVLLNRLELTGATGRTLDVFVDDTTVIDGQSLFEIRVGSSDANITLADRVPQTMVRFIGDGSGGNVKTQILSGDMTDTVALEVSRNRVVALGFLIAAIETVSYNPPNLAAGASTTTTVTILGATVGWRATAEFSIDGLSWSAAVTTTDTVTVTVTNSSAEAVNLGAGDLTVKVAS